MQTTVSIKHELTDEEKIELSGELAKEINEFGNVMSAKRATLSGFKSTLEDIDKKIQGLSSKIMRGYYWEEHVCIIEDDLETNMRYYKDPDTLEVLKSELIDNEQPTIFERSEDLDDENEMKRGGMIDDDEDEDEEVMTEDGLVLPSNSEVE